MTETTRITVARGDGIGPEIMEATLRILDAAGAGLGIDEIHIGERMYQAGHTSGIPADAWATIRRNSVLLKSPITTPQGGGYKSLNVTLRKALNLFANVRPTRAYTPFVASPHPGIDLVIIRENEEDLYAGIEHQQTADVTQVLKLVTRSGSERIVRYAFEYARAYGRRRVTCMTKDNIMKITDGLFHRVFDEVAAEYPDIAADHQIIDIGAARLASQPETFDVIVTLNLYGDIISDIAALVAGSVGLAGSANIGTTTAMFEAVHGSAPDIAGKGIANPSGLLLAATQMLVHLGQAERAETIANAWLCTLESGLHPADIFRSGASRRLVGTEAFTTAVIERLGEQPRTLAPVHYRSGGISVAAAPARTVDKAMVGVDVFLDWNEDGRDPNQLGRLVEAAAPPSWRLKMITNRGVKVYPDGIPETYCTDHWRARCVPSEDGAAVSFDHVLPLLAAMHGHGLHVIKTEHLYTIDGRAGYSLGQGE
ncbi:NADP-dependent isocitrate dehydrogenase [Luteitalea sp.]|uniref:NADP-dependent isocitrate dehydrogenase n=1 Tax=Luteitalea sp. TaxID=2004800 RepID=UPI0025BAF213|nr:NADP-dependent isocitrate dehydrogenase [Luteitalea sp.]